MCVTYGGIEYHYGFDVAINLNSQRKRIYILMSRYYMDDQPYAYAGLCLNNALQVSTNEDSRSAAVCSIITKVVDGVIGAEELNARLFPSQTILPRINFMEEYPRLSEMFTRKARSLDEYNALRKKLNPFLETPKVELESLNEGRLKPDTPSPIRRFFVNLALMPHVSNLYDCREMVIALNKLQKDARFHDSRISYCRV